MFKEYLFAPQELVGGNRIDLCVGGPEIFSNLLSLIDEAKFRVAMEVYTFETDETGQKVRDALIRARARGCEVKLMYDGVGSVFTPLTFFNDLIQAGGEVLVYHALSYEKLKIFKRNHRKIFLIDAQKALVGGFNIANAYAKSTLEGGMLDVAVKIEGPVCSQAWHYFDQVWSKSEKKTLGAVIKEKFERRKNKRKFIGNQNVQVVGNDHVLDRWRIRREILFTFSKAQKEILIMNPYFLPDPMVVRSLIEAKKRGVKVNVLIPSQTDVPILNLASQVVQRKLVERGVGVYVWPGFLHGKAIVVDDVWLSVGSYNFDYRSLFHNLELVVQAVDQTCAKALSVVIMNEISVSKKVTEKNWVALGRVGRFFARLLYRLRALL